MHAITAQQGHLADLPVGNALGEFLHGPVVPRHQSHADLQILSRRRLAQSKHAARRGPISRQWLFHKDMQPLLDGVAEVNPTEGQRRGEDGNVSRSEAVHRLLAGIKPDELAFFRHIHPASDGMAFQRIVGAVEVIPKNIRHGHKFQGAILNGQRVDGGTRATAAATDQGNAQCVVLDGMNAGNDNSHQR
ncbi:MAG TPA: hypothetical protein VFV96_11495 [Verrucomicrobiae bacterium]|nr:hypothetical protein [Verrucomicrobiae bacterium]